jgi:dehydrogenase/reductase SDR family protein 12
MDGRVVLVSGATSGIGLAAATAFAELGARVHLIARDAQRGERARTQSGAERVWDCDVSSLRSVRDFARRFRDEYGQLHVLVNNAGVLAAERSLSEGGYELALATNVLGPLLLTGLFAPALEEAAPSTIVNVSSGGMYTARLSTDDLQTERHNYDGAAVYARHKRAQVVLSEMWAERLNPKAWPSTRCIPAWWTRPGSSTRCRASTG